MQSKAVSILLLYLLAASPAMARHQYQEKEYQRKFCAQIGGEVEHVLDDRTRVDCLTDEYAIEVDFAPKWAESVGQALYYAAKTGRKPGVLLIIEDPREEIDLMRLHLLGETHRIRIWTTGPGDLF